MVVLIYAGFTVFVEVEVIIAFKSKYCFQINYRSNSIFDDSFWL